MSRRRRRRSRQRLTQLWPFRILNVHCTYCIEKQLEPSRFRLSNLPLLFVGLWRFICPHCFHHFIRVYLFWDTRCLMADPRLRAGHGDWDEE